MLIIFVSMFFGNAFHIHRIQSLPASLTPNLHFAHNNSLLKKGDTLIETSKLIREEKIYIIHPDGVDSLYFKVGTGDDEIEMLSGGFGINGDSLIYVNARGFVHVIDLKTGKIVRKTHLSLKKNIINIFSICVKPPEELILLNLSLKRVVGLNLLGDCISIYNFNEGICLRSFYSPNPEMYDIIFSGMPVGYMGLLNDTIYLFQNFEPFLFKFTMDGRVIFKKEVKLSSFVKPPSLPQFSCKRIKESTEKLRKWLSEWTDILNVWFVRDRFIVVYMRNLGERGSFVSVLSMDGEEVIDKIDIPSSAELRLVDQDGNFYFISAQSDKESILYVATLKDSLLKK